MPNSVHKRKKHGDLKDIAQRIEPIATWDDLNLPEAQRPVLHEVAARVRQGPGTIALLAGDGGTGKEMAAEVLANELRLDLYRIRLSAVVSKYIGEIEKNLRRLFDAAEDGCAILFFDEADALFGKRSEVKDSHDRYANIEINFPPEQMEHYRGLTILATKTKSELDPAFLRRVRFIVTFPVSSAEDRRKKWKDKFPNGTSLPGQESKAGDTDTSE